MKLYSYQQKCIEAIKESPSPFQLISMPTGTGKTITFLNAAKELKKKTLFLVHRQELLNQTIEKALRIGIEKENIRSISAEKKEKFSRYNVAMVQSLLNNLHLYAPEDIEMIVVDEAHHSLAPSYLKLFEHFKIFEENKVLLGFTATPLRGDGKSLGSLYKHHTFKMTLQEATQQGYICPVHGIRFSIKYELGKVENRGGDYDISELDKIFNCDELNEIIAYKCENIRRVPAIIFCTTVNHAERIRDKLLSKNRTAEVISYHNSKNECTQILERFKDQKIEFLLNAVKLTEGFDYPQLQTIVVARPTRSPALYKQMIGRGLRCHPSKYDCLVMEFGSNDPKMITWESIDMDSTFQCFTEGELVSREKGKQKYNQLLRGKRITLLDVRVSPFSFYECKIQRILKYRKYFRYVPHEDGFMVAHILPHRARKGKKYHRQGHEMMTYMLMWKDEYKSFTCFSHGILWKAKLCWTIQEVERQLKFYADRAIQQGQNGYRPLGKWYPSEEQHITPRQKIFLEKSVNTNARRAEMIIEEKSIIKAINKFWINSSFPSLEEDEDGQVKDSPLFII